MSRADIHTRAAREAADWLDEQGEHFRANAVRSVCKSLSSARATMAVLHRDNAELRARHIAPGEDSAHVVDRS